VKLQSLITDWPRCRWASRSSGSQITTSRNSVTPKSTAGLRMSRFIIGQLSPLAGLGAAKALKP
jgi:hypothetical protein